MPEQVPDVAEQPTRGLFICLEGGEGVGKTTLVGKLGEYMRQFGRTVREVADPGETVLAKKIRELVLDNSVPCTPSQQTLLYVAARNALAGEIRTYLDAGIDVISGRWTLSTLVYQGKLGEVGSDKVDWLTENFIGLHPDIYILLDVDPVIALTRKADAVGAASMQRDRFDGRDLAWHTAVRNAYVAHAEDNQHAIVDASGPLDTVQNAVIAVCRANTRFRQALSLICATKH